MGGIPKITTSLAFQRILTLLGEKSDLALSDIAAEAYVGLTTLACGGYIKKLKESQPRLIHISGWRRTRRGFCTPLYSLGDKPDLPKPLVTDGDRNSLGMQRLVEAIRARGPMDYVEAAGAAALSPNTVKNARYLEILVEQDRLHICQWRRHRAGPMRAVYAHGQGECEPKPAAFSGSEKTARYRSKLRALQGDRGLSSQLMIIHHL